MHKDAAEGCITCGMVICPSVAIKESGGISIVSYHGLIAFHDVASLFNSIRPYYLAISTRY